MTKYCSKEFELGLRCSEENDGVCYKCGRCIYQTKSPLPVVRNEIIKHIQRNGRHISQLENKMTNGSSATEETAEETAQLQSSIDKIRDSQIRIESSLDSMKSSLDTLIQCLQIIAGCKSDSKL